jgi:CRISPR system Cascade subunit CasD
MTVLLLHLAAPLQSWGTGSRFARRNTDRWPSRSGVLGLLAAARGMRRTDPLEDLLPLRIGVRVEQPGRVERDFQTARTRDGATSMPLSYRFYLADAGFLAAVEGEAELIKGLHDAVLNPIYPLYLGRRSCPPAAKLVHGVRDGDLHQALKREPWLASRWVQRAHRASHVDLDTVIDCPPGTQGSQVVRDDPISFDLRRREYGWRSVLRGHVTVPNPEHRKQATAPPSRATHAPMDELPEEN